RGTRAAGVRSARRTTQVGRLHDLGDVGVAEAVGPAAAAGCEVPGEVRAQPRDRPARRVAEAEVEARAGDQLVPVHRPSPPGTVARVRARAGARHAGARRGTRIGSGAGRGPFSARAEARRAVTLAAARREAPRVVHYARRMRARAISLTAMLPVAGAASG